MSLKSLLVPKLKDVEFLKTNLTKTKIYIKIILDQNNLETFIPGRA